MTDTESGADIEIVVIADDGSGGPGPSGGSVFVPVRDPFKTGLQLNSALYAGAGIIVIAGASILAPVSVGGIILGSLFALGAVGMGYAALDPPQPDFTRPARVKRLTVRPPSAPGEEQGPSEALPLLEDLNSLFPLTMGLVDAMERFQGARDANDERWAVRHARGAELLAACSTTKQLQLAGRLKRFRDPRLDALELDRSSFADVRRKARSGELLPERVKAALLDGGVTGKDLADLEQTVATSEIESLPVGDFKRLRVALAERLRDAALRMVDATS
jgi:hypothetical protein